MYSSNEKVDMLLIYGECHKNSRNAARVYAERYPARHHPCFQYFPYLEKKFREARVDEDDFIIDEATEINVLAYVEMNPTASTREIGHEVQISHESSRKILKKHGFRSFKYQLHQHLYEEDGARRTVYCQWLLQNNAADRDFISSILFTDESRFTNNGMFNKQNVRYWARENQHLMKEGNFQERFGVNVWAGIIGSRIIGPILFQGALTGERYLQFLQNDIEGFLNHLPFAELQRMYYQQDGAPPHNTARVLNYLTNRYENRVIATNGPVRWPARSPDLTPLDFFVGFFEKPCISYTTHYVGNFRK